MNVSDDLRRFARRLAGHGTSAEEQRLVELFRNRAELKKELAGLVKEAESLERKLATPGFVERAPANVVEDTRARVATVAERRLRLAEMLKELGA